ncbi:MAG: hypothetical protein A3E78_09115 [Alphaproteobacteria bacterium RIFCSPHIGHO2_12_FULL_63_12]|nr:MAG: hypothetical protein A3E78_09115 [Alphaproteobacteria bacterium RIFCSPHIGHO2_12_FULL_63_12]
MNPFDSGSQNRDDEAILEYLDAEFAVVKPGRYVRCAATGARIPLEALKYWNVDKQEPYANAEAAMVGFGLKAGK